MTIPTDKRSTEDIFDLAQSSLIDAQIAWYEIGGAEPGLVTWSSTIWYPDQADNEGHDHREVQIG
jgi:hypothetical protein